MEFVTQYFAPWILYFSELFLNLLFFFTDPNISFLFVKLKPMSTTETKEKTESGGKPEVGVTGRKIVYDKDGKP